MSKELSRKPFVELSFYHKHSMGKLDFYYLLDRDGLFHGEDQPAVVVYSSLNSREEFFFYFDHGVMYRKDQPAGLLRYKDAKEDLYHESRVLKPNCSLLGINQLKLYLSECKVDIRGYPFYLGKSFEAFMQNSFSFREKDLPSSVYLQKGDYLVYSYQKLGKFHRENGPAYLKIDLGSKKPSISRWYLEGLFLRP